MTPTHHSQAADTRPAERPAAAPSPAELLALFADPAAAGRRAQLVRAAHFGPRIWIRPAPAHPAPRVAAVLRGEQLHDLSPAVVAASDLSPTTGPFGPVPKDLSMAPARADAPALDAMSTAPACPEAPVPGDMSSAPAWPALADLAAGDRLIVAVGHDQLAAYCAWLAQVAVDAPAGLSLAPCCPTTGGLFRLHLIAAARLALPACVRVEVRHDLHGVRLAQVALGFGADTLAGPIDAGRHLPLAGVPRPSETSEAALCELVRQAGLEPLTRDPAHPRTP